MAVRGVQNDSWQAQWLPGNWMEQSQVSCFTLIPGYANSLLVLASYLVYTCESDVDLLTLSKKFIPQNVELFLFSKTSFFFAYYT